MLPGVWESAREWTPTLPSELPLWELESWWIPEFLESDCKSQNPLNWYVPYIIEKILECKCLKWARMTHLNISNTSYGQKKGSGVKLAVWLLTTKSLESPRFPYVQVAFDMLLEIFWQGL
jgi:hypothetical protein